MPDASDPLPAWPTAASGDADLVERLRRGDPDAETEFVARFGSRVRLAIASRVRDREAVREIANDSLFAAITAVRKGQLRDGERLAGFVRGICRNLANSHIRSAIARPPEVELSPEVAVGDAAEEMETRERRAILERAISRLEPLDRRILTEALADGRGAVEIAARVGVTPEVVRARKSRALRRIAAGLRPPSRNPVQTPPREERAEDPSGL